MGLILYYYSACLPGIKNRGAEFTECLYFSRQSPPIFSAYPPVDVHTGIWEGCEMTLTQLALQRAGFDTLLGFQRAMGLAPSGQEDLLTRQALLPYLTGYEVYRLQPGDTYARLAQSHGTTVRALVTANPDQDPERLVAGQYLTVPFGFSVVPTTVPFTYTVLQLTLQGLKARYPFLIVNAITQTRFGRKVPQIAAGIGTRRVVYNASHHANEWITTPVLLRFLEQYAQAVSENGSIFGYPAQELYQRTKLHMVPMVNPDGVDLVTGAIAPDSEEYRQAEQIAARYPQIPFPDGWKANLSGVDLNLNYPAGWENARQIKFAQGYTTPAPRDYVGAAPLDQPESAAMAELTRLVDPRLTLSYHTQGNVIYWKYLDMEPPGARQIGERFADVSGYLLEDTPRASGYAGYKDWFILIYDRPGYTIEVGLGESPLPLSQFEEIYRRNLGILTLGLTL